MFVPPSGPPAAALRLRGGRQSRVPFGACAIPLALWFDEVPPPAGEVRYHDAFYG